MPTNIDDNELARLEELKQESDDSFRPYNGTSVATIWYELEAANAVPALVAEVRRLRAKIDPLDWWAECVYVMRWLNESRPFDDPFFEAMKSVDAAERAVHADRE